MINHPDNTDDIEARHLTFAVSNLAAEFPDVPPAVIAGLVRDTAARYQAATVRNFLSILVTKDVRAQLRADGQRPDVPAPGGPAAAAAARLELAAGPKA